MSYSIADRARFFLWNALICFVDPVWIRIEVGRRREERGQQLGSKALIRENLQGVGFFECASISVTGRRTMKKIIPYLILLLIAACGPQFYLPETKDRPRKLSSARTRRTDLSKNFKRRRKGAVSRSGLKASKPIWDGRFSCFLFIRGTSAQVR